jgi:cytochrome P450
VDIEAHHLRRLFFRPRRRTNRTDLSSSLCPPGPRISRLDALLLTTRWRDPLIFLADLAREYGDIAHFQIGSQRVFLLNHPDYIKDAHDRYYESFVKGRQDPGRRHFLGEGLLTAEGELHRRHRRLIQPAFHKHLFAKQEAVTLEQGSRVCERWRHGQQVNIVREMKRLTLSITSQILFNTKTDSEAEEISEAMKLVVSQFAPFGSPLGSLLAKLPMSRRRRRIDAAKATLDGIVRRLITERRQSGEEHDDLLSTLVSVVYDPDTDPHTNDLRIRDEAVTFFLAGFETLGTALAWTWYLLSQNPAAQAELQNESDRVLGSKLPSVADLHGLRYTKAVFAEAMRIYPPIWLLARYLINDFEAGGYVMPTKSIVIMSQYLMHRDPRYFPDPLKFDPGRWTPEAKSSRPQYSYFPFGGGPRGCLGEGLAWTQGLLLIALLAQRWRMKSCVTRPLELQPGITLQPKHDIVLQVEQRDAH